MRAKVDFSVKLPPCLGGIRKRYIHHPVCVECIKLNGQCGADQSEWEIFAEDTCIILFCIDGKINLRASFKGKNTEHSIPASRFCLYSCPNEDCSILCKSKVSSKMLQILFPLATLFSLLERGLLPPFITGQDTDGENAPLVREVTLPMTRVIGILCDALMWNKGPNLLVLSKALELLWLCLESLPPAVDQAIDENDRRAVQKAMFILDSNLGSPPGLIQLAHMVGMSASKFKKLFPKAFGIPPYEYLRKKRMEKAMYLLKRGGMNVTEVAMEVGYSSISHFTKVFYKEFNITPSQAKKGSGSGVNRK